MEKKLIIFVCTGNTCRSPMAEALFKSGLTAEEREIFEVKSCGLAAFGGDPASENAVKAMDERGIDISTHRSAPLNLYTADEAYLIVTMTESHTYSLLNAGIDRGKIITLGVSDPYCGDLSVYRRCADDIKDKLEAVYARLRQNNHSSNDD